MAKVAAEARRQEGHHRRQRLWPGHDAETAFKTGFEKQGGTVVESIRMPMSTNDFSPIMQRIKDSGAEAVFAFLPSGPPTLGFVKAYNENGLKEAGIKFLAPGDLTQESDLPALGDARSRHPDHLSLCRFARFAGEQGFRRGGAEGDRQSGRTVLPVGQRLDGMHVIYKMIEATGGKQNAQKAVDAVKGLSWVSPRGPVSIDPETPPHHPERLSARSRQG